MLQVIKDLIGWLKAQMRRKEQAEPPGDPFADVTAPLRPRPQGRAGAVALEEPGEDDSMRHYRGRG